jgi:hypothetical protein
MGLIYGQEAGNENFVRLTVICKNLCDQYGIMPSQPSLDSVMVAEPVIRLELYDLYYHYSPTLNVNQPFEV